MTEPRQTLGTGTRQVTVGHMTMTDTRPGQAARSGEGVPRPALRGVVSGWAGLAVAELAARLIGLRETPVEAAGQWVIELTPQPVVKAAIDLLGTWDKPVLLVLTVVVLTLVYAGVGWLAARSVVGLTAFGVVAAIGALAVLTRPGMGFAEALVVVLGLVVNLLVWATTAPPRPDELPGPSPASVQRRTLIIAALAVAGGAMSRVVGRQRQLTEQARSLLRLPVTKPTPPAGVNAPGVEGVAPWQTPTSQFFRIDTALSPPAVDPATWRLRIHGQVERELTLSLDDLVGRQLTEAWVTISCVSNPVGGDLVGNAWWSGVRIADLLAEAGVTGDADAIYQTSVDGWTCATPLEAVTDDRDAMLAVAMNGEPLPVEHGFPVRMIVPGLYGFVSATKWITDIEVTRFDRVAGYWTPRGWAEQAPVRLASRIDRPAKGAEVPAGMVAIGGSAWHQQTGIKAVEVAVDEGEWVRAQLASVPSADTWVQWSASVEVEPGEHEVVVRAINADGEVQTDQVRPVAPDGATGRDAHRFTAV